jgi:putative transposase
MNGGQPQRRRHSLRLKGFDYTQPGAYFVTIVTQNRTCLLGEIAESQMQLNRAGDTIARWWLELTRKFTTVETDEFIVMPNHCHGIVIVTDPTVGADLRVGPPNDRTGAHAGAPLPEIVQWFKTMTTNEYMRGVKTLGWPAFRGQLWQRNYYEHVIRNDDSLNRIRQYIVDNPIRWDADRENPAVKTPEPKEAWRLR